MLSPFSLQLAYILVLLARMERRMRNQVVQNGITQEIKTAYRGISQRNSVFVKECPKCGSIRFTYSVRFGFPVVQICVSCDSVLTKITYI